MYTCYVSAMIPDVSRVSGVRVRVKVRVRGRVMAVIDRNTM